MSKFVKTFREMTRKDFQEAGGKAANLGELTQAGFNVPPGFCVTSSALSYVIAVNGLSPKIADLSASFNYEDFGDVETKTAELRDMIERATIPDDLHSELKTYIHDLVGPEQAFVAVRSSVAVKDSEVSSFPGMMDTFHYLKGEEEIMKHIRMCYASLWTGRAVFARHHKGIPHDKGLIAPTVQKMVFSEVAGILFTANPITSNRDELVIESNWGLGESVVSGKSMNDFFLLDKQSLKVKVKKVAKKTVMCTFDDEKGLGRKECSIDPARMDACTLSEAQVQELGRTGRRIEQHFGFPQDIEWAYEKGQLYILQSRNIRTLK